MNTVIYNLENKPVAATVDTLLKPTKVLHSTGRGTSEIELASLPKTFKIPPLASLELSDSEFEGQAHEIARRIMVSSSRSYIDTYMRDARTGAPRPFGKKWRTHLTLDKKEWEAKLEEATSPTPDKKVADIAEYKIPEEQMVADTTLYA